MNHARDLGRSELVGPNGDVYIRIINPLSIQDVIAGLRGVYEPSDTIAGNNWSRGRYLFEGRAYDLIIYSFVPQYTNFQPFISVQPAHNGVIPNTVMGDLGYEISDKLGFSKKANVQELVRVA